MTTIKELEDTVQAIHGAALNRGLYREGAFKSMYAANELVEQMYAKPFLHLQRGEPTNGRDWALFVSGGAYGTGHSVLPEWGINGYGHLGWTKREALDALHTILDRLLELPRIDECTHGKIVLPDSTFPLVCERKRDCVDYVDESQV